jgi:hypothetical protein
MLFASSNITLALAFPSTVLAVTLLAPSSPAEQAARARAPAPSNSVVIRFIGLLLVCA